MKASSKKKAEIELLAQKILDLQSALATGRAAYQRADALQDEIEKELKLGTVLALGNGQEAELVDPWSKKSKVWRHTGVRRYELDIRDAKASAMTSKL